MRMRIHAPAPPIRSPAHAPARASTRRPSPSGGVASAVWHCLVIGGRHRCRTDTEDTMEDLNLEAHIGHSIAIRQFVDEDDGEKLITLECDTCGEYIVE